MKHLTLYVIVLLYISITSCNRHTKSDSNTDKIITNQKMNKMKSHISLFEIPAIDITRAVNFYQNILDIKIEIMAMPGMEMGIFPYENQLVTGVIMKAEGSTPSKDGVTIYLDGGEDLQNIIDKVEKYGGLVLLPKTAHADESGYFALFLDTEGNRLGLNSPK